jgi:hypothetical protein
LSTLLSKLLKASATLAGATTSAGAFLDGAATRLEAAEAAGVDLGASDLAALDNQCAQLLVNAKGYSSLTEALLAAPDVTPANGGGATGS